MIIDRLIYIALPVISFDREVCHAMMKFKRLTKYLSTRSNLFGYIHLLSGKAFVQADVALRQGKRWSIIKAVFLWVGFHSLAPPGFISEIARSYIQHRYFGLFCAMWALPILP